MPHGWRLNRSSCARRLTPSFLLAHRVQPSRTLDHANCFTCLAGFGHTLIFFFVFWSRDLVQKLRAEILRILAAVARPELNSEAHVWPKLGLRLKQFMFFSVMPGPSRASSIRRGSKFCTIWRYWRVQISILKPDSATNHVKHISENALDSCVQARAGPGPACRSQL